MPSATGNSSTAEQPALSGRSNDGALNSARSIWNRDALSKSRLRSISARMPRRVAHAGSGKTDEWCDGRSHHKGEGRPHAYRPWQCLNFLPEPQGQDSLRPTLPQLLGSEGLRSVCASPPFPANAGASPAEASDNSSSPVAGSRLEALY